jgi:outer membrane protein
MLTRPSVFVAQNVIAQEKWSLADCIDFALQHNSDLRRQQVQNDKQAIQIEADKFSRLPNLTTGGTQKFDFGRSLNRQNLYEDIKFSHNFFFAWNGNSCFYRL